MIANTPKITITIEALKYDDEDTGREVTTPVVRAMYGNFSAGFITLKDVSDLLTLRKSIDEYLTLNNECGTCRVTNQNLTEVPAGNAVEASGWVVPEHTDIIRGYLSDFTPVKNPEHESGSVTLRTSQAIALDLVDIVDISLNEVAACMSYLGYRAIATADKVGWALYPASMNV